MEITAVLRALAAHSPGLPGGKETASRFGTWPASPGDLSRLNANSICHRTRYHARTSMSGSVASGPVVSTMIQTLCSRVTARSAVCWREPRRVYFRFVRAAASSLLRTAQKRAGMRSAEPLIAGIHTLSDPSPAPAPRFDAASPTEPRGGHFPAPAAYFDRFGAR